MISRGASRAPSGPPRGPEGLGGGERIGSARGSDPEYLAGGDTMIATDTDALCVPRRSGGLLPTLWPADHGDTARRKFVVEGGLPADLDPARIQTIENADLPYVQWMYTRGPDERFVYGVPGAPGQKAYLAKIDARTLKIWQKRELPKSLYIGGALMHRNGHVYLVHGPHLYRFDQGDLDRATETDLPAVNGVFTQYNGMHVTEEGSLLLKGWAMDHHELDMMRPLVAAFLGAGVLLGAVLALVVHLLVGGGALALGLVTLVGPLVLAGLLTAMTGTSWVEFFRPRHTGHLLLIDPDTLAIRDRLSPPERCAYARTALVPANAEDEMEPAPLGTGVPDEWLVIAGDERIMRWRVHEGRMTYDPTWTEQYRRWGDGTFPGTGPCVYRHVTYYTDNTFPVGLEGGYRLFRKELDGNAPQTSVNVSGAAPGFMFFAVVVSPKQGDILIWDTNGAFLEARRLSDLQRRWRVEIRNTDCLTVAADRDHIYVTDHSAGLGLQEYMQSVSSRPSWPDIEKSFVVLHAGDGKELLRVPLGKASPIASMIVPGPHDDVFVATRPALVRVYQD